MQSTGPHLFNTVEKQYLISLIPLYQHYLCNRSKCNPQIVRMSCLPCLAQALYAIIFMLSGLQLCALPIALSTLPAVSLPPQAFFWGVLFGRQKFRNIRKDKGLALWWR